MLSKKELFKLFSDRKPRRVPVIPFVMQYAAVIAGISYRDYCKKSDPMAESQLRCLEEFDYDAVNVSSDAHRLAEALGGELFFPEDGVPVVKDPPIKSPDDLKDLTVPDPMDEPRCRQRIKAIELLKEERPEVTVIGWVEGALSDASSIFGPTDVMKAFYRDRAFLKKLFRFAAEFDKKFALAQVKAGADIVGAGDSLASQISTENFELSVEYTKEIFRSLDVPTLYHVCGDTTHQLEVLRGSRADIVDLDREVDLVQAREVLGSEMVIRGNVDPVLFVQGKPARIEELSEKCIQNSGEESPFILSAGCEIPPDSQRENLEAMVKTSKEFNRKL